MIRLFNVSIPTSLFLLVISDALIISGCYVGALFLGLNELVDPWFYIRYENGWIQIVFAVIAVQLGLYFMDMYEDLFLRSRKVLIQNIIALLGAAFLIQALIGYTETTTLQLPQWTMIYGSVFVLPSIALWRFTFFSIFRKAVPNKNVLFVGMSPSGQEIVEFLALRPDVGFTVIGYLEVNAEFQGSPHLGPASEIGRVLRERQLDLVVIDQIRNDSGWLSGHALLDLRSSKVRVESTAQIYEMVFGRVSLRDLNPSQILFEESTGRHRLILRIQTLYSVLLGWLGLLVFSPIMVIVFALVKFSSPGPAFYSQRRVGKNGAVFSLYKFRSMYIDAEARTGPVWATKNDPRITPLGRWLRKLRLDELPQFFNVIRGEMVLVGPRPERPEFCEVLEKKIPFYHQRHSVKPGITGWAQINLKYTESVEETILKIEYDLYYIKHLAPMLDAYILFHTIKVMLLFRGAQ